MNTTHKRITINASSAIIQVVFTAILYFFLYKYLLDSLGVKLLGVWSLILSFSSIANMANLGLTSGLVKFVAEYLAENNSHKIGNLIFTSFISLVVLFSFISLALFLGGRQLLQLFIEKQFLTIAISILPWSLASLSINAVSGVFTSVLEGYQKNYLRNFIFVFSGIIMFGITLLLTPTFGLKGIAMAQLMQAIVIMLIAAFMVIKISPTNRISGWKWSSLTFKDIFHYGYKFQAVSICQLLYEPTTKILLSKFGGLALLGHYEMASRLINQFRAMLINANQVVIPIVAEAFKSKTKEDSTHFYINMSRVLALFTIPLTTALIVLTPLISIIWIGENSLNFCFSMYVLAISSMFNILCGPSYFSCLGEGRLSLLVKVHVLMAILNLGFGYLLGLLLGGYGNILGWGLALIIGSIVLVVDYNKTKNIYLNTVYSKNEKQLGLISLLLIGITIVLYSTITMDVSITYLTLICFCFLAAFIPVLIKNKFIKSILTKTNI